MSINNKDKINAVRHIIATLYSAQNALRSLAPEFNWSGMGNLGDHGEFIATYHYGLKKDKPGKRGSDALLPDGTTVQVKTNHSANSIGFRGQADKMLVLKVDDNGNWRELYFGDFNKVKDIAYYSSRDNKYMVPITKLESLNNDLTIIN
jgi:hypothetical protein